MPSYLPMPLVGPRPVLGEPLVPLSMDPTPGEVGFEEPPAAFGPAVLVAPDAPLDGGLGQSAPELLLAPATPGVMLPALDLPFVPRPPLIAMSGQALAAPDAEVPGVCEPPVEPGRAEDGLPRSDLGSAPCDGAPGAA